MEKISFKEVLRDSLELVKLDKKRFGFTLFVLVSLGVFADIFSDNPFITTGMIVLDLGAFVLMTIMAITGVKNFKENNEIIGNQVLKDILIKTFWRSLCLKLVEGVVIVLALIVFVIPLAMILVYFGPKLGTNVNLVTYFAVVLFAIPLIIVNVMISFSMQFFLIKNLGIIEAIKSSYLLVKNSFKKAMIIGMKINFFYYIALIIVFRISLLGPIITGALGIFYILMTTFAFYKLTEKK